MATKGKHPFSFFKLVSERTSPEVLFYYQKNSVDIIIRKSNASYSHRLLIHFFRLVD